MKKILFLSGTRADFSKMKPLMHAAGAQEGMEVYIFVTGMHMFTKYGSTIEEIYNEGFTKVFPYFNQMTTTNSHVDIVLANTICGLGHYVRELVPDLLVIHGDRLEALAGAIVGSFNRIRTAHIEGGELSGTLDEIIRHAITKLSHIHFTANDETRNRLLQLGEKPESIFVVGSPDMDIMLSDKLPQLSEVLSWYGIPFAEFCIFMYHPVHNEVNNLPSVICKIIDNLIASDKNYVIVHPNNDPGSDIILRELNRIEGNPRFKKFPSMRFESFITLMKNAQAIIGNSSAGIREAPAFGIPTINIGTRQHNRYHHSSIVNVNDSNENLLHLLNNLPEKQTPCFHFGFGDSALQFIRILKGDAFWESALLGKQFQDNFLFTHLSNNNQPKE